jgi:hypothetical protein
MSQISGDRERMKVPLIIFLMYLASLRPKVVDERFFRIKR